MKRKGARSRAAIEPEILCQLNEGTMETASLPEALAVDFVRLLNAAAPELAGMLGPDTVRQALNSDDGITVRMRRAGELLAEAFGADGYERFSKHPSDTVRGWSAYLLASLPRHSISQRIRKIRRLADDPHFGVREWAWIAIRNHIGTDIQESIRLLTPWVTEKSDFVRRFACEITRPRGVWCSHLPVLKEDPSPALPLLDPLRSDSSKYVRDSVANWLNDAGKSQPQWVKKLCRTWEKSSPTKETRYIIRRGLRSLDADS